MPKKPAVIHFIETKREEGLTEQQITHQLLDAGWEMDIIQHAMTSKTADAKAKTIPIKKTPRKTAPEVLIHPYFIGAVFLALVLAALFI